MTGAANPAALERVEHIVVLMLENRSFDHMLGYLALPEHALPDHGELPSGVNGLAGGRTNSFEGTEYGQSRIDQRAFTKLGMDPPHDAKSVATAMSNEMGGFVEAFARKLRSKADTRTALEENPDALGAVMRYLVPEDVPVYDRLARNFCVCDAWNCSIPGPTLPNRFFAVAGTTDGYDDNGKLLLHRFGKFESFFHHLRPECEWRWYSSDPAILRAVDSAYSIDSHERFAYFDEYTQEQPRNFLRDVRGDDGHELPEVAWVDPNFAMKFMLPEWAAEFWGDGPGSNDDHPPAPAMLGQKLVNKVYEAVRRSRRYRDCTLILVVYDEHGGFYDHEQPPPGLGPRVPALAVSPLVKRGVCSEPFEHASIAKTVLLRFGVEGAWETAMGPRVRDAVDLSVLLRDSGCVPMGELKGLPPEAAIGPDDLKPVLLPDHGGRVAHGLAIADHALTELQYDFVHGIALPLRSGVRSLRYTVRFRVLRKPLLAWRRLRDRLFPPKRKLADRRP